MIDFITKSSEIDLIQLYLLLSVWYPFWCPQKKVKYKFPHESWSIWSIASNFRENYHSTISGHCSIVLKR